jgi:hypothetical protein
LSCHAGHISENTVFSLKKQLFGVFFFFSFWKPFLLKNTQFHFFINYLRVVHRPSRPPMSSTRSWLPSPTSRRRI